MPCRPPLIRPKKAVKTANEANADWFELVNKIQIRLKNAQSTVRMMRVFRGPMKWSATRAGMTRPGRPTALMIRRKVREDEAGMSKMLVVKMLIWMLLVEWQCWSENTYICEIVVDRP